MYGHLNDLSVKVLLKVGGLVYFKIYLKGQVAHFGFLELYGKCFLNWGYVQFNSSWINKKIHAVVALYTTSHNFLFSILMPQPFCFYFIVL
jgi:hypothetical protein